MILYYGVMVFESHPTSSGTHSPGVLVPTLQILSDWSKAPFLAVDLLCLVSEIQFLPYSVKRTALRASNAHPQFPNTKSLPRAARFLSGVCPPDVVVICGNYIPIIYIIIHLITIFWTNSHFGWISYFWCWKYQLVGISCYTSNLRAAMDILMSPPSYHPQICKSTASIATASEYLRH